LSKARSKVWFRFKAPSGECWTVFFSLQKKHPRFFAGKAAGTAWFGGRFKNRIYIDASLKWELIQETLVHEIMHVVMRPLGLSRVIDEAIVDGVSEDFALIMRQAFEWPELEES
jgi:hypothetical protein